MENKNTQIRVSQKAILYDEDGKLLSIRRSKTDQRRPLYWDLPGGELEYGEEAKQGIIREIKEETGMIIEDLSVLDVVSGFDDYGEFWVTICYLGKVSTKEVILSLEHDEFKWVIPDEFLELKASNRNKEFVLKFKILSSKYV